MVALGTYGLVLTALRLWVLDPTLPFRLDPPSGLAATVVVPFTVASFYSLAAFSFGLGGDVAARESIYPARLFTLPVTTRALAGWPMLFGAAAMASLWLLTAALVRVSWGVVLPLAWPALLGAVMLAWVQALSWMPYPLPGLRVVVSVLLLMSLDAIVIVAVHFRVPESRLVALLAPQLPVAYLAACFVLARARRGDVPDWRGAFARFLRRAPAASRRAFASPVQAQAWFEWRQHGRVLPALVCLLLPFELGLLALARDEPLVMVWLTLLAMLLTPPLMAGWTAAAMGGPARDTSAGPFTTTRPLTSAALVAAKLRMAARSTLAAWLLVGVALPLGLVLTDTAPRVSLRLAEIAADIGKPRAAVVALLVFLGLLASTWKALVQSLYIDLTASPAVIRTSLLVRLSALVALGPLADPVSRDRHVQAWLFDRWLALPVVLVVLKMTAACWVVTRLHRSRLLSDSTLLAGATAWLAAVLTLYAVLVWLVATPEYIPRYVPALCAILAVPLTRVAAAPLALAWSRHRGRPTESPAAGPRVPRLALLLLAVPLLLLLSDALSFGLRHRSNGILVSSGEPREYLLHVPKTHDRRRPTPLVISMHGAGGWPGAQREASLWNALSDRDGFLVAYPSGTSGRGPRVWNYRSPRDVRFVSDLIDALVATHNIDPTRVYADGLSNGGGMAFVLSCALSDRVAAVAMVAPALLLPFEWCTNQRAVPMIAFHGTADRFAPYHGGTSPISAQPFASVPKFVAGWARRNRCAAEPVEAEVAKDVTRRTYRECADGAVVEFYTLHGGGHTWPGGGSMPEWFVGPTNREIDATRLIWDFFRERGLSRP